MANRQQQSSSSASSGGGGGGGYSSTVPPSNLDAAKLGGFGGHPPPPLIQTNQIPSPSIKTPNLPSPANGIPIPHMSTPPGPPVFSSPLQPAAVPFRTSPATPQPIASYSSTSSLPTSSPPPHFSNGLLHQTEELAFAPHADSPDLLFSAHKVHTFYLKLFEKSNLLLLCWSLFAFFSYECIPRSGFFHLNLKLVL